MTLARAAGSARDAGRARDADSARDAGRARDPSSARDARRPGDAATALAGGLAPAQLERFVARLAGEPRHWRQLIRHESDVRVYEQICADARVNAWLICWSGGQDTGFHDHDESAGAISVIRGRVRDERLAVGAEPRVRVFTAGQRFNIPPTAIHRVIHDGAEPAITIHAYSPPLTRMGAYRVGPDGELAREALSCEQELRAEHRPDRRAHASR